MKDLLQRMGTLCFGVIGLFALLFRVSDAKDKPFNLIFVFVDDAGWTDLGIYGSDLHETPNLDRFAKQNMMFTAAYTPSSISTPVRASLMTGKNPARLNMTTWFEDSGPPRPNDQNKLLPPETVGNLALTEFSLGSLFRESGYFTASVGKWHLGEAAFYPEAHGFDINIGGTKWGMPYSYFFPFAGWRDVPTEELRYRYVPGLYDLHADNEDAYLTDRLTDHALEVIEAKKEEPFYLQLSYYTPHVPLDGKEEFISYYEDKIDKIDSDLYHQNPRYAAMMASLDENFGRIVDKVEEAGISDHTIIIFYSDNGGLASPRVNEKNNYPLRSGKGSLYEGGVRVPLLIKWPGVTNPGSVSDTPVTTEDFYATFLDMLPLEGDEEHNRDLDGISMVPILENPEGSLDREALYWHHPHYYPAMSTPASSIRKGDWKLLQFFEDNRLELYNLETDLGEQNNLAETHPGKAQELLEDLRKWRKDINAQMPTLNPDYVPETW